nr:histidine phosphatase family protein [uncultured Blautia sp.]
MLKIWLIRHGMTEGNRYQRYIGVTDEPLCEEGRELLRKFTYPKPQAVFVSPLKRCLETAAILFDDPKVRIIDQLAECDFGEFENKNYKELSGDPRYQEWIDSNGILAFPGGESKEECAVRNLEGFQRAVTACIREEITEAALVVHGGTIMNIMEQYVLPKKEFYEWHVGNGCGYLVELDPVLWKKDRRNLKLLGEQK